MTAQVYVTTDGEKVVYHAKCYDDHPGMPSLWQGEAGEYEEAVADQKAHNKRMHGGAEPVRAFEADQEAKAKRIRATSRS